MTTSCKRFIALITLLAFTAGPVSAQVTEEVPMGTEPVIEVETPEVIEEEPEVVAPEEELIGEILATSTEVAIEEEQVVEEEPEVPQTIDPNSYVPGEIIVKFNDDEISDIVLEDLELETKEILAEENIAVVETEEENIEAVIAELEANPEIEYAEPNYIRTIEALSTTSDPYADELWGLEKIQTSEAWNLSAGEDVIVAVLDTGIDYLHEDLAGNMWDGSNCVASTSIAIPGGCTHGYDFVSDDTDPIAEGSGSGFYHGTHVAGTIAAQMGNHLGVAGVAPNVKIMSLRIIGNSGGSVSDEVEAIRFAIANGAKIINASFSGFGDSKAEEDAIIEFRNAGGIFIASAGNGGADQQGDDLDNLPAGPYSNASVAAPAYPAQHDVENIISVAATDSNDELGSFSNYGQNSVDLGAPGVDILSATPSGYAYLSGTSMSAPHVSGTVALLKAFRPNLGTDDMKELILESGDSVLPGATVSGKRLNTYKALLAAEALTADTEAPVITLIGSDPMGLAIGELYVESGATASDNIDGDLTSEIQISGVVDTNTEGTYGITYTVSDSSGNTSELTRTVNVATPVVKKKKGGGGGGGGGSKKEEDPLRYPQGQVLGASTTLSPEVQAQIAILLAKVQELLKIIAAMKAAGLP